MSLPRNLQNLTPPMLPVGIQRPPSAEEKAEVERLNGLQIRTNAALQACQRYHGTDASNDDVLSLARVLADFIEEG